MNHVVVWMTQMTHVFINKCVLKTTQVQFKCGSLRNQWEKKPNRFTYGQDRWLWKVRFVWQPGFNLMKANTEIFWSM